VGAQEPRVGWESTRPSTILLQAFIIIKRDLLYVHVWAIEEENNKRTDQIALYIILK
jgi:hypothetical protein